MTAYIQDFLQEQGIEIDVGYDEESTHEHRVPIEEAEQEQDPAGPMVRQHNPMAMHTATIDSYQGQEKDSLREWLAKCFYEPAKWRHINRDIEGDRAELQSQGLDCCNYVAHLEVIYNAGRRLTSWDRGQSSPEYRAQFVATCSWQGTGQKKA